MMVLIPANFFLAHKLSTFFHFRSWCQADLPVCIIRAGKDDLRIPFFITALDLARVGWFLRNSNDKWHIVKGYDLVTVQFSFECGGTQ